MNERFEMGKNYRAISTGRVFGVVFVGTKHAIISYLDTGEEFCAFHSYLSKSHPIYEEVKPIPVKDVHYLNVYKGKSFISIWSTRREADLASVDDRIACIRVEFEEGQFDD